MRIATWNLERGGKTRAARRAMAEALPEVAGDVLVLTEPGPSFRAGTGSVTSPRLRDGERSDEKESWVAIVGESVTPVPLEIPFRRMAVAAFAGTEELRVVVYGSVLPWSSFVTQAPELAREGEMSLDAFVRVLEEQVAEVATLQRDYPDHVVIWAGDFNQHVSGPNHGGSAAKREALVRALEGLGLLAWNGEAAHDAEGLCAIDLICGPRELPMRAQGRIEAMREGVRISDHAGYWVEI